MTKQLVNIDLSTGTQVFSNEAEFASFINALNTAGSSMEQIYQYVTSLMSAGVIISQKHHRNVNEDGTLFTVSKIFASEEAALNYREWLVEGDGKDLIVQWMQPLGWSFTNISVRPLTEEEFDAIAAELN